MMSGRPPAIIRLHGAWRVDPTSIQIRLSHQDNDSRKNHENAKKSHDFEKQKEIVTSLIDMAEAEHSHNEQLVRIAQDIVVEELQEIEAMRAALGEKLTPMEATLAAGNGRRPRTPRSSNNEILYLCPVSR